MTCATVHVHHPQVSVATLCTCDACSFGLLVEQLPLHKSRFLPPFLAPVLQGQGVHEPGA